MKQFKFICALVLAFSAFAAQAAVQKRLPVVVKKIFVPKGFDSNDTIQVILSVEFPNLCYKSPMSYVKRDGNNLYVGVTAAYEAPAGGNCVEAVVPFLEKVTISSLDAGEFTIIANEGTTRALREQLPVVEATVPTVDDHIYASVDYVETQKGSKQILIKGYNPSDCFEFDRVEFISNNKDVYSVLPIMKKVRDLCPMKLVDYTYSVEVPNTLDSQEILLHVRSMNGDSVNALLLK